MNLFSQWQPRYAGVGLPIFPVAMGGGQKRPMVRGYLRIGADTSRQLAMRFPDASAFGFALGTSSKVTVLDVDAADERILADALNRHGSTPIIIRSGSGNFQGWYRHAGEGRRIRPFAQQPIDILGGGFVVGPPSEGSRRRYEMIAGQLDDLDRLPVLRGLPAEIILTGTRMPKTGPGERNSALFRNCMRRARRCQTFDQLLALARIMNEENMPALPDEEVLKTAKSAWGYESRGENRLGASTEVILSHELIDKLAAANPNAFALAGMLERHHQFREVFTIANAMAESIGWHIDRLRLARATLVEAGVIRCVHPGGKGPKDPALYAWT